LLGGGGREHAITWMLSKSPMCEKLYISPGNAGTASTGTNVTIDPMNFEEVGRFVIEYHVDFVIVGPEDPIVRGIADYFSGEEHLKNIKILAPTSQGAQLEGSKDFAKQFMQKYNIPTASYRSFLMEEYDLAREYLINHSLPVVVKADGLAAGKGVTVCYSHPEALEALDHLFVEHQFGKAGDLVVIEEFLDGIEMSAFALTDGNHYVLLPGAKDYKRAGEGDTGPNTGGMGCISPVPFADEQFMQKVRLQIIEPTIYGLRRENIDYRGFLFCGIMNVNGNPFVIEYNVRLGDPETEVILPRIDEDILPLLYEAAAGHLRKYFIMTRKDYAATVMAVSSGYPGAYDKGKEITGLDKIRSSHVFHAGTIMADGRVISSGGRVLCITSLNSDLKTAIDNSYSELEKIQFENKSFRKDIGQDLLKYLL
jgi:phosphoribosylamine---glycine ligase